MSVTKCAIFMEIDYLLIICCPRPSGRNPSLLRLTASSMGHICNKDIFVRSIEMKCAMNFDKNEVDNENS